MRLSEYCKSYSIHQKELAEKLGLSYSIVCYVIKGYGCSYDTMEKIIKGTQGKVTFEDLKPLKKASTTARSKYYKKSEGNTEDGDYYTEIK